MQARCPVAAITGGGCPANAIVIVSYGGSRTAQATVAIAPISKWIHLAVDEIEHAFGRLVEQRIRAERASDSSHHDRRLQTMTGDVADDDPQLTRRQREDVVPVPADRHVFGGDVPRRECEPRILGSFVGNRLRSSSPVAARSSASCRVWIAPSAIGHHWRSTSSPSLNGRPSSRPTCSTPEEFVAAQQRNAEHHLDAFLPQDRIGHRRRVDPVQPHGLPRCGDPAGEADSDGNAHSLANLVLDTTRCSRHQTIRPPLEEEHRGRVDGEDVAQA